MKHTHDHTEYQSYFIWQTGYWVTEVSRFMTLGKIHVFVMTFFCLQYLRPIKRFLTREKWGQKISEVFRLLPRRRARVARSWGRPWGFTERACFQRGELYPLEQQAKGNDQSWYTRGWDERIYENGFISMHTILKTMTTGEYGLKG